MPIEVKTYKEYLADEAEASRENVGDHCFVAGCTNPPTYYQVGNERFWCGMCKDHAGMRKKYLDYVRTKLMQCGVRFKINKEASSGNPERAD